MFVVQKTWEGMEQVHKEGLAKSIGISNFSLKKLGDLLPRVSIRPAVHQVSLLAGTGRLADITYVVRVLLLLRAERAERADHAALSKSTKAKPDAREIRQSTAVYK